MRTAFTTLTVVLCLGVAAVVPTVASAAGNPTQSQIPAAVRRAEGSRDLWATVNICNSRRYPDYLGVRGQMPSLGFPAWLSMRVQLLYYDHIKKSYVPVPSRGTKLIRLGRSSSGLQQAGALFQFAPHQPPLRAPAAGPDHGQHLRRPPGGRLQQSSALQRSAVPDHLS